MSFQFVHLETYARKADAKGRSVGWVLDEASREPGACSHVASPVPPELIHGVALSAVRRLHDEACEATRVTVASGKERAVRKDQKSLLTVVASHPASMDQVRSDPATAAAVAAWETRTVNWLRERYSDGLLSVVRHVDEKHAHLHAYILPPDLRAARLHPGAEAKRAVVAAGLSEGEDAKALNRRGDAAYKQAMRAWQDSYWEAVGLPSGLTRLGPARRRLTRAEWQAEQTAVAATRAAVERTARISRQGRDFVKRTRGEAAAVVAAAKAQAAAAKALHDDAVLRERRAATLLERAGRHAQQLVASAEEKASRLASWGGRLRTLWDGLRRSSIAAAARRAAAADVARERARAEEAAHRVLEEASRRREAEQRARAAAEAMRVIARERDHARRQLDVLRPAAPDAGMNMGRGLKP